MTDIDSPSPTKVPTRLDLPDDVRRVVEAAQDKKAIDLIVLDLRGTDAFTDFFVVCSGQTDRQVRAIVDEIQQQLKSMGERPSHIEGYDHAEWVLLDCFDFVVHVFTETTRRFYDLERLWGSATRIDVGPGAPARVDAPPRS